MAMVRFTDTGNACAANASVPTRYVVYRCPGEFKQELQQVLSEGCRELTVDLRNVEVIDSRGLSTFVQCYKSLSHVGGHLKLMIANENLRHLFRLTQLDQYITISAA